MKPNPLPSEVSAVPFTVAAALQLGVSPGRLRAADLDRTWWGVRDAHPQPDLAHRCRMLLARLPANSFISHTTAALLHGIPVPLVLEREPVIHVTVPAPHRAPHAAGIRGHVSSLVRLGTVHGVRVSTPAATWIDLATLLDCRALTAAGDFVIYHRSPLASLQQLLSLAELSLNRRGRRSRSRAFLLLDGRSESPPESVLRVILGEHGFVVTRINHVITDRFGEFVARTDFYLDEIGVVLEYMGDYHRTTIGQWRSDMTRRSRIELSNVRVMELNADDLRDENDLVARIRALATLREAHIPRASK